METVFLFRRMHLRYVVRTISVSICTEGSISFAHTQTYTIDFLLYYTASWYRRVRLDAVKFYGQYNIMFGHSHSILLYTPISRISFKRNQNFFQLIDIVACNEK